MQIVLLSGGAGKRLWPLSNDLYSKQFLRLLRRPDGTRESMIQRVCRQVREAAPGVPITIAAARSPSSAVSSAQTPASPSSPAAVTPSPPSPSSLPICTKYAMSP